MTWFKLDDDFFAHPKVLEAGNAAIGLFARLGSWCSKHNHQGHVPTIVATSSGTRREIDALIRAGMLEPTDGGYLIHDFNDYNPTAEQVAEVKAKRAEAGRRGGKQKASNLLGKAEANDVAETYPVPGPVPNELKTDDISKSAPDQPPSSSSPSFAQRVTKIAARILADRPDMDVRNPDAWCPRVAREMLVEREDRIRQAHAKGLSDQAAAEFILTDPVRPDAPAEPNLTAARRFGASIKHQHLEGDDADLVEINRDTFIRYDLPARDEHPDWNAAAIEAYDDYQLPPKLRAVE